MAERLRVYQTEAVVLRRHDLGETDRVLTLLSPDRGKLRAVAKGVRRPGSRKAGHLEPFTRARLVLAKGRELDIITQAEAQDLYPRLRQDLVRLGQAAYAVELMDRFTVEEGQAGPQYRLLVGTLERLEAGAAAEPLLRHYELRLLEMVGYRPELFRCLGCDAEVRPEDQFFSAREGGVLCPACGPQVRGARPISLAALKVLRHYQRNPYERAVAARVRPQSLAEAAAVLEGYITYLLERRLNAPAFLRRVRGLAGETAEAGTSS